MTARDTQHKRADAAQYSGVPYRACPGLTSEYGSFYYWWYFYVRPDAAMHP